AGVYALPVVFQITNNQWAISVPRAMQTRSETLAQKCVAYGFDGIQVDGNDPLAVYAATKEAVDRARSGGGPTLIEAVTYRLSPHTTADDPKKYRTDEEVAKWEKLDPLIRYAAYLRRRGVLDDALDAEIRSDLTDAVKDGVERYEAAQDVNPLDCFKHLYSALPDELQAQREEYRAALDGEAAGAAC
ncbi:MAG: thiamine pyrophosphate-dependent enzyme, partial [Phycisphaerae bacterium]